MATSFADPATVARTLATGRLALGAVGLLAPRTLVRLALRGRAPGQETVAALRMAAGRDLALGLGALLAARRGPRAVRGWVEAGALADATDALAFLPTPALRPTLRWGGSAVAAAAAAAGVVTARRLTGDGGRPDQRR